jgi:ribonuclease D
MVSNSPVTSVHTSSDQSMRVTECESDIPDQYFDLVQHTSYVSCDIETSGLNWRTDIIGTCQIYIPNTTILVIKISGTPPKLISMLQDSSICKIFHHAMFDLRFMSYQWQVTAQNIACTKIASKLLDVNRENGHTLQSLLKEHLNVTLQKSRELQRSNWVSENLSQRQVFYAAADVVYLAALLDVLHQKLATKSLLPLAYSCYQHIPTQVLLDVFGYSGIYDY